MKSVFTQFRSFAAVAVFSAALALLTGACNRNNPLDEQSTKYVPGKAPHLAFVKDSVTAFLLDTLPLQVAWTDTNIGGTPGSIKEFYYSWRGGAGYTDSIAATDTNPFVIRQPFPAGTFTFRVKALDAEGNYSEPDSITLFILPSRPKIVSISAPFSVEKMTVCSLSVVAADTGGAILSFLWARNGMDFLDTTSKGSFTVSYADTGRRTILVKAVDNKGIESGSASVQISVFEKFSGVTYSGNGSTGGSVPVDSISYAAGQTVTVLSNSGNLTKSGYAFAGWNTQPNGGGATFEPQATFAMDTLPVTLFAQWSLVSTYKVTYIANGSTAGSAPVDSNLYTSGAIVMVQGNTGSLVKTNYAFTGWNTQANGAGVAYASGVTFVMGLASVTLYAQWSAKPTFTVTYVGNGNTSGAVPSDPNNYLTGALVTVFNNTGSLARGGFTFVGWNTKADGSGTAYAGGVTFAMGSAGVALYAQWSADPTFTVAYSGNGNTGGTAPTDANSYLPGTTVTTRGPGNLSRTGWAFAGWNTKADGSGTSYAAGATFAMGVASVTLFARWSLISTYTVAYNANGEASELLVVDHEETKFSFRSNL